MTHLYVELAATAVAVSAAAVEPRIAFLVADCVFGWSLLTLAWIDGLHRRLPDAITLPLILTGLGVTAFLTPEALTEHGLAAAFGYGLFRLVSVSYRALRGRDGLGEGDAKLLAAIEAWLGFASLPQILLIGALSGIALIVLRRTFGTQKISQSIAFGPHLIFAAWLVTLYY